MKRNNVIMICCLTFAILFIACNSATNTNRNTNTNIHNTEYAENQEYYVREEFVKKYQQDIFPIDANTDWDKPLYSLGETNDTIDKWTYLNTDSGMCIVHKVYPGSFYSKSMEKTHFDKRKRIISTEKSDKDGIYFAIKYYYDGNVRIGNGKRKYDCSMVDIKEITYFLDNSFKYDTLSQTYIGIRDTSMVLNEYIKSKYEKIGDKYFITESRRYAPKDTTLKNGDKRLYRYNSQNLLVGELTNNIGEYGTILYSYKWNSMDWSDSGTGATIYYDTKK